METQCSADCPRETEWSTQAGQEGNGGLWSGCFGRQGTGQPQTGEVTTHHRRGNSLSRWFTSLSTTDVGKREDFFSAQGDDLDDQREYLAKLTDDLLRIPDMQHNEVDIDSFAIVKSEKRVDEMNIGLGSSAGIAAKTVDQTEKHIKERGSIETPDQSSKQFGESPRRHIEFDDFSDTSTNISRHSPASNISIDAGALSSMGNASGLSVGGGYKKLWRSITKSKKNNASRKSNQGSTVESMKQLVISLKSKKSMMESAELYEALCSVDSRALAALLKDLSKAGHQNQSCLLFDYIRQLPEEEPLSTLADIYTYTTIISQCGALQMLTKALELVQEMKKKGIKCNIHTYSALMGVCVKSKYVTMGTLLFVKCLKCMYMGLIKNVVFVVNVY